MINPLGNDLNTVWNALKEGKSGVQNITIFDPQGFPTTIAAEIKNWDVGKVGEDVALWAKRGRHSRFAIGAAKQAVQASGFLDAHRDPTRIGVYMGAGEGNQDFVNFTTMMAAGIKDATSEFDLGGFLATGIKMLDANKNWNKSPTCPRLTWQTSSMPKAPMQTA